MQSFKLSIVEYWTHNKEQFGASLTKMKQILSILQGVYQNFGFSSDSIWRFFWSVGVNV